MKEYKIILKGIERVLQHKAAIMEAAHIKEDCYFDIYSIDEQLKLGACASYPRTHEFDVTVGICDNLLLGLDGTQIDKLFSGWVHHTGHKYFPVEGNYNHYSSDADYYRLWLNPKRWALLQHVYEQIKVALALGA